MLHPFPYVDIGTRIVVHNGYRNSERDNYRSKRDQSDPERFNGDFDSPKALWWEYLNIRGHTMGFLDQHEIFQQHAIMARLLRIVVPGYPHHVTQRGVRSMNVFHEKSDRRDYLGMLGEEIALAEIRRLCPGLRRSPVGT